MSIPEEKISNILIGCRQLQKKPVFTYVCILLRLAYIDKYTFQFKGNSRCRGLISKKSCNYIFFSGMPYFKTF